MSNARDKANIPALNFSSTGIDDNATSTAITIDSSERVGIGTSSPISDAKLTVSSDNTESNIFFERSGSAYDTAIANSSGNILFKGGASSSTVSGLNELMRITSSGKVGIGTTSPVSDAKLTISSNSTESYVFFQRSGSTMYDTAIGNNGGNILFKGGSDSSTVSGLNEFMRIDGVGGVGIGTTTTNTKLNVVGTGVNGINLGQQSDNTANSSRLFFNNSTNIWTTYSTAGSFKIASGATIGTSSGTDRLVIDSSGRIGIGTSSPDRELTVGGVDNARIGILSTSNSVGASQLQFGDPDNSQVGRIYYEHSDDSMRLHTNNTERMRIDSSGNIGIGTSSPTQKLDVSGTVKATAFQGDGSALTGVGGGITEADNWRITANFAGDGHITSNWERNDNLSSYIGSGISESSGTFTFPSTGIYLVNAQSYVDSTTTGIRFAGIRIFGSNDGNNFSAISQSYDSNSEALYHMSLYCSAIYDVTNTSNNKIRLHTDHNRSTATDVTYAGNTTINYTALTFIRLGDT